jgi:hypothetical protein
VRRKTEVPTGDNSKKYTLNPFFRLSYSKRFIKNQQTRRTTRLMFKRYPLDNFFKYDRALFRRTVVDLVKLTRAILKKRKTRKTFNAHNFIKRITTSQKLTLILYITYKKRNYFSAIMHLVVGLKKLRLLHKFSAGLLGFAGPKRKTFTALNAVAKETGKKLSETKATFVDIVFPFIKGSHNTTFLRTMLRGHKNEPIFIRHILMLKGRVYGIHRGRKIRRV